MSKKKYFSPIVKTDFPSVGMAVPLAFFSAATAAAAVTGAAVGAVAAAKLMGDDRSLKYKVISSREVEGLLL